MRDFTNVQVCVGARIQFSQHAKQRLIASQVSWVSKRMPLRPARKATANKCVFIHGVLGTLYGGTRASHCPQRHHNEQVETLEGGKDGAPLTRRE